MIIENNKQLEEFTKEYKSKDCIVIPIECDINKHPLDNQISLIYVNTFGDDYILPINHNDSLNIPMPDLVSDTTKYTIDKKRLSHLLDINNVIDVNLMNYMKYGVPLDLEYVSTNAHDFLSMKFFRKENINNVIPIMKHLEKCREMSKVLIEKIDECKEYVNMSYNEEILNNLGFIESNGLKTIGKNLHGFISNGKDMIFSEYNLFTSTGRPSNRFGGINFAALNKKDGSRKHFISRFENGVLVEMDFDAYHLRLIADKIGYEFPKGSVHEHMAEFYGVNYEESKALSFQYLYGFIPKDVMDINPYFEKVDEYIRDLWSTYKREEFILSDIYNRQIFKKNLVDMNANKLFNYTIQLMETENNMKVLSELIPKLKGYESKLILYSYDSFLFDFNVDDGLDYLIDVKNILEQNGKYPVKVSSGTNYHEMKDITEKFV